MKRLGIAIIALGATMGYVHADNWAGYVSPQSSNASGNSQPVMQVCMWNNGGQTCRPARTQNNCGCGSCGNMQCGNGGHDGKLLDFLTYRPTPPCQCCPEPAAYTPPLYTWFPSNGCTGAFHCGGEGCSCAGKTCMHPLRNAGRQPNGCATCAARIGAPVTVQNAPTVVAANKQPNAPQNAPTMVAASKQPQVSPYGIPQKKPETVLFPNLGKRQQPQDVSYVNYANKSQSVPVATTGNKSQNVQTAIYPPSTIMPQAAPAVVPAAVLSPSPYGGLPGGYRVEPNRNVLPARNDTQNDGGQ